ncbi:PQQ-dependent sugar dehydrogenase [Anaerocolumna cellulosilytica]|nr:PQQ-dependent sugar dehydrogenase [Anaerocolumna cellulosilytica]MBB5194135.1 glucose/arabinose dehydrogenase [Anaerocolumna cellulosilytica]
MASIHSMADVTGQFPYRAEIVAENLRVPWAIDISEDGTIYFTERIGNVQKIKDGLLLSEPIVSLKSPFISQGESGLMGLVLDPDFGENHYLYLMYTYRENGSLYNRIVRFTEEDDKLTEETVIFDKIPASATHNGGRIKIGPDNKLYIATGDANNTELPQDKNSLGGKILRIELDGSIPVDNPFPDSPVYSLGFRNPQGIAFNSNAVMYASEHGELAQDEINVIIPGGNYGWPLYTGNEGSDSEDYQKPLVSNSTETWAPSGLAFITQGPFTGQLLAATLRGNRLLAVSLEADGTAAEAINSWLYGRYGRLRDVFQAKDGSIYLLTSNTDARGLPQSNDDKLIQLIPTD